MKELEQARQVFLTDIDEEDAADNLERINAWEKSLIENQAFLKWQNQDITKQILDQAKKAYQDASVTLSFNRDLDDVQRNKLYATQDACMFMIGLMAKDAKSTVEQVQREIREALKAVS